MTNKKYPKLIIILLMILSAAIAFAAEQESRLSQTERISDTRTVIEKWIETQEAIATEKENWAIGQQSLNYRIELVKDEIESLKNKINDANQNIVVTDNAYAELLKENESLKTASNELTKIVINLETDTRSLVKKIPDSVSELINIKPFSQHLPEDPNQTQLSLSQRCQNIVGILNAINKFNQEIAVISEVRNLDDGSSSEVTTMYIGLGQAFYVNGNNTIAGVGIPGENGWTWETFNGSADKIAEAIAIFGNDKVASFVPLPVKVK